MSVKTSCQTAALYMEAGAGFGPAGPALSTPTLLASDLEGVVGVKLVRAKGRCDRFEISWERHSTKSLSVLQKLSNPAERWPQRRRRGECCHVCARRWDWISGDFLLGATARGHVAALPLPWPAELIVTEIPMSN
jgi:hypothetical protein